MQEMQRTRARFLVWEDPLVKEMTTHSSTLAWDIPWTEEPSGPSPWGCKRVGHYLATQQQDVQMLVSASQLFQIP